MNMSSYSCCNTESKTYQDMQSLSSLLRLVGEESRLSLLCILRDQGEHCVCELLKHADGLSQSLTSHHLADLKKAGLVESKKVGLRSYYSLTPEGERVVETIFTLIDKGEDMKDQKDQTCCCKSVLSTEKDENSATEKSEAKCCESCGCGESKKCSIKESCSEDRSCGNGMCDVQKVSRSGDTCC